MPSYFTEDEEESLEYAVCHQTIDDVKELVDEFVAEKKKPKNCSPQPVVQRILMDYMRDYLKMKDISKESGEDAKRKLELMIEFGGKDHQRALMVKSPSGVLDNLLTWSVKYNHISTTQFFVDKTHGTSSNLDPYMVVAKKFKDNEDEAIKYYRMFEVANVKMTYVVNSVVDGKNKDKHVKCTATPDLFYRMMRGENIDPDRRTNNFAQVLIRDNLEAREESSEEEPEEEPEDDMPSPKRYKLRQRGSKYNDEQDDELKNIPIGARVGLSSLGFSREQQIEWYNRVKSRKLKSKHDNFNEARKRCPPKM